MFSCVSAHRYGADAHGRASAQSISESFKEVKLALGRAGRPGRVGKSSAHGLQWHAAAVVTATSGRPRSVHGLGLPRRYAARHRILAVFLVRGRGYERPGSRHG